MTLGEAREKMAAAVKEIQAAGFEVWGWDDGSVILEDPANRQQTWVDPDSPDVRPEASVDRAIARSC